MSTMFGGINGRTIKVAIDTVRYNSISTPVVVVECKPGHRIELTSTLAYGLAAALRAAAEEIEEAESAADLKLAAPIPPAVEIDPGRCPFESRDLIRCDLTRDHDGSHAAMIEGRWQRL